MKLVEILVNQQRVRVHLFTLTRANTHARSLRQRKQELQEEIQQLQHQIQQMNTQQQETINRMQREAANLQNTINTQTETIETYRNRDFNKATDAYPQELESILHSTSLEYFKDQYRRHCVLRPLSPRNGTGPLYHYELEEVDGENFSLWLREEFRQATQQRVTSDPRELRIKTLKLFIESIKSRNVLWRDPSTNQEFVYNTHLRYESTYNSSTGFNLNVYVDLGDQARNIIRVSRSGVYDYGAANPVNTNVLNILDDVLDDDTNTDCQTFFQRYPHQKPSRLSRNRTRDEDVRYFFDNVFRYIRIIPDQRTLFIGYLVSCMVSHIQHPVLAFFEPQQHGKRTAMGFIKQLIDDSQIRHFTKQSLTSSKGMDIVRQHYWIPVNDVEKLTNKECETLFSIATGVEDHFNNSSSFIRRCLAINGPKKPKMMSQLENNIFRLRLERISIHSFQTKALIEESFQHNVPRFRMALFHLLSGAIGQMETINSQSTTPEDNLAETVNYRQEFVAWSRAAVMTLASILNDPTLVNNFDAAYRTMQEEVRYEQHDKYPLVEIIFDFLYSNMNPHRNNPTLWSGPASLLLSDLHAYANQHSAIVDPEELPKLSNDLSKKVAELESQFNEHGIRISRTRTRTARSITFLEDV